MSHEKHRRDFLKASAASAAALIAGNFGKGGEAAAQGATRIPEVDKVVITVITDNYYDTLRASSGFAKRSYVGPGRSIHAEHGLSYYIQAVSGGDSHAFLFDYGIDLHGVTRNIEALKLDLKKVEALGLSHGHWDHWANLAGLLKNQKENLREGLPLYVGEEAFSHRFTQRPTGRADLGELRRDEIEKLGLVKIREIRNPTPIVPGAYLTGNIERVTDYEKCPPGMQVQRGDKTEHDTFPGEQGLMFNVRGKGLVVVTSCAHAGVVNTTRHAQKVTGIQKVHAIMGGMHLSGARPEVIQRTVADIKAIGPEHIVPMHCTGFEAIASFFKEMPDQFFFNTAGTEYTFAA